MTDIIKVCAWCDREINADKTPGALVPNHQNNESASHGICRVCKQAKDIELVALIALRREARR